VEEASWERGIVFPSPLYRQLIAEHFQVSVTDLGLARPKTTPTGGATGTEVAGQDPPSRHLGLFLGRPVITAATVSAEPIFVESLLITLRQYATMDNLIGPHSLLPVMGQQMTFIENLLTASRGRNVAGLLYVAARFAEFGGWLHQDSGDLRAAMQWSNTALDLAQECGDAHLTSYIRMRNHPVVMVRRLQPGSAVWI
jgi:hypothetical protein